MTGATGLAHLLALDSKLEAKSSKTRASFVQCKPSTHCLLTLCCGCVLGRRLRALSAIVFCRSACRSPPPELGASAYAKFPVSHPDLAPYVSECVDAILVLTPLGAILAPHVSHCTFMCVRVRVCANGRSCLQQGGYKGSKNFLRIRTRAKASASAIKWERHRLHAELRHLADGLARAARLAGGDRAGGGDHALAHGRDRAGSAARWEVLHKCCNCCSSHYQPWAGHETCRGEQKRRVSSCRRCSLSQDSLLEENFIPVH